jgi:hypothetical protein
MEKRLVAAGHTNQAGTLYTRLIFRQVRGVEAFGRRCDQRVQWSRKTGHETCDARDAEAQI